MRSRPIIAHRHRRTVRRILLRTAAGVPLVVFPGGTLNHFARDLGLDSVDDAVEAVRNGQVMAIDVGTIADRLFVNNASIGSYSALVDERERLETRLGKWPAMVVALGRVLHRGERFEVTLDGEAKTVRHHSSSASGPPRSWSTSSSATPKTDPAACIWSGGGVILTPPSPSSAGDGRAPTPDGASAMKTPWSMRAACRGLDPIIFFPADDDQAAVAKDVCTGCDVRQLCLDHALGQRELEGIWGGCTERERRRIIRRRRRTAS